MFVIFNDAFITLIWNSPMGRIKPYQNKFIFSNIFFEVKYCPLLSCICLFVYTHTLFSLLIIFKSVIDLFAVIVLIPPSLYFPWFGFHSNSTHIVLYHPIFVERQYVYFLLTWTRYIARKDIFHFYKKKTFRKSISDIIFYLFRWLITITKISNWIFSKMYIVGLVTIW